MKRYAIALAIAVLIGVSALTADDMPGQPQMMFSDTVPNPIPRNICVEVHLRDDIKGHPKISVHHPPLDDEERQVLQEIRKRQLGTLKRCRTKES